MKPMICYQITYIQLTTREDRVKPSCGGERALLSWITHDLDKGKEQDTGSPNKGRSLPESPFSWLNCKSCTEEQQMVTLIPLALFFVEFKLQLYDDYKILFRNNIYNRLHNRQCQPPEWMRSVAWGIKGQNYQLETYYKNVQSKPFDWQSFCLIELSICHHMGTEGCHYNPNHGIMD